MGPLRQNRPLHVQRALRQASINTKKAAAAAAEVVVMAAAAAARPVVVNGAEDRVAVIYSPHVSCLVYTKPHCNNNKPVTGSAGQNLCNCDGFFV